MIKIRDFYVNRLLAIPNDVENDTIDSLKLP